MIGIIIIVDTVSPIRFYTSLMFQEFWSHQILFPNKEWVMYNSNQPPVPETNGLRDSLGPTASSGVEVTMVSDTIFTLGISQVRPLILWGRVFAEFSYNKCRVISIPGWVSVFSSNRLFVLGPHGLPLLDRHRPHGITDVPFRCK